MTTGSTRTATAALSDTWVHDMMTSSIASAVATAGLVVGLAPLRWSLRIEDGEILIQGSPAPGTARPVALCREWAGTLSLQECDYDEADGVLAWNRYEGPWLIEISTRCS